MVTGVVLWPEPAGVLRTRAVPFLLRPLLNSSCSGGIDGVSVAVTVCGARVPGAYRVSWGGGGEHVVECVVVVVTLRTSSFFARAISSVSGMSAPCHNIIAEGSGPIRSPH